MNRELYEFDIGDVGKTKNGIPYRIISKELLNNRWQFIVVNGNPGDQILRCYHLDGRPACGNDGLNLLPPIEKRTIFVNVCPRPNDTTVYPSAESARCNARSDAIAVAVPVTFEFVRNQGK